MKPKARLWLMMFLQYATWGSWLPVAPTYFQTQKPNGLGLTGEQLGILFALMPLSSLIMSPWIGRLADRYFRADRILALLTACAAVFLFLLSRQTTFLGSVICLSLHCLCFAPCIALCNAIGLSFVKGTDIPFSSIRVGGTIGWISAGFLLTLLRTQSRFEWKSDLFVLGSIMCVVLCFLALTLPAVPPPQEKGQKMSSFAAFALMKDMRFLVFMLVAFVICTQFDAYYLQMSNFLTAPTLASLKGIIPESVSAGASDGIGVSTKMVPFIMTLGQISEIFFMLALPYFLKKLGMKWTLFIGIAAWPLRFLIFAFLPSVYTVLPAMALHGVCVACFLVAGSVFVEQVAPPEIRASAQGLFAGITNGIGRVVGSFIAGKMLDMNTIPLPARIALPGGGETDHLVAWGPLFAIPAGLTLAAAVVFPLFFDLKLNRGSKPNL